MKRPSSWQGVNIFNIHIKQNRMEENTRRVGTVLTHALQNLLNILFAALMFMQSAEPHFEQSAVSC
jgi:hypothetical protein